MGLFPDLVPGGFGYNVATLQFLITLGLATFDIYVVWLAIWIPFVRNVKKEDRQYLFRSVGETAHAERLRVEAVERVRNQ